MIVAGRVKRILSEIASESSRTLLMVGAGEDDLRIVRDLPFAAVEGTNIDGFGGLHALDAEEMDLPDDSHDVIFFHGVLHHCRSPHRALLEACRVARQCVIFVEGNDSAFARMLDRGGWIAEYEFAAVIASDYQSGGVRNTRVPNYVYRWDPRTIEQTVKSGFPERQWTFHCERYFDAGFRPEELESIGSSASAMGRATRLVGARTLVTAGRIVERVLNATPLSVQGNRIVAVIRKGPIQPWIEGDRDDLRMRRDYFKKK